MASSGERRRHHRRAKRNKAEEFVHGSCGMHHHKDVSKHMIGAMLLFAVVGFLKGIIVGYLVAERKFS